MRITNTLKFGEKIITVKELTLAEIRAWLSEREQNAGVDIVGSLLLEDCPVTDLLHFCDATQELLDEMTQSEIRELLTTVKRLNPDFFAMRLRLLGLAARLTSGNSNKASAPSSPGDM